MSLIVFITIMTVIALLIIILMIRTSIHKLNHSFMGTHQTALDIVQNHHRMMRTKQQLSHLRRVSDDEGVESHIYPTTTTTTSISSSASSAFRPFSETTSGPQNGGSGDESAMMTMMLRKRRGAMRVAGANEETEQVIANRENEIFSRENDFQEDAEVENSEGDIRDQPVNDQPMITVDDYFSYCDDGDDRHVHGNKQSPAAVLINRKRPSYTREIEDTEQRELKRRTEYRTREFEKRLNETIGVKRGRRYPSLYPIAKASHEEEEHDTDAMNVEYYHDDGDDQSPPYEDEGLRYEEEVDDVNTEKRFKQTIADDSLNVEELSMSDEEGDEEHRDRLHDVTLNRDQASSPVEEENEEMEPLASELNRSQTPESIENIHNEMRQMSETRAPARPIRSLFPIRRVISHQRLLAHPDDIKARISLPKKMMKVIDAQSSDINNLVDRTKEDTAPILEYVSLGDEQQSSQQTTSTTAPASTAYVTFAPSTTQPSISFSGLPASNTFQFGTNSTTQQQPQTQTQTQPLLDLKFTFTPNPDLPLSTTSVTTQPATSIQPAANTAINFGGVPPANTNTGVNEPKTPTKFTGGELFGFGTPFAK